MSIVDAAARTDLYTTEYKYIFEYCIENIDYIYIYIYRTSQLALPFFDKRRARARSLDSSATQPYAALHLTGRHLVRVACP